MNRCREGSFAREVASTINGRGGFMVVSVVALSLLTFRLRAVAFGTHGKMRAAVLAHKDLA